jgi:tetratricopeptide (TPR) repeat protein
LARRPRFPEAQENLGDTLLKLGDWQGARQAFELALRDKPDDGMAVYGLATALRHLGETAKADEEFTKARSLLEANTALGRAQGENNRGLQLWYAGDLAGAAAAFRGALTYDPSFADAHNNLGGVLWQQKNTKEATQEFAAAVRYKPDFAKARNNYGNALMSSGDLKGAAEQFEAAVTVEPGFATGHFSLGTTLAQEGQSRRAEEELRQALILDPQMAAAHVALGLLLASNAAPLGSAARSELEEGLRLNPQLRSALPPTVARELDSSGSSVPPR